MPRMCPHCKRVPRGNLGMHIQFCPALFGRTEEDEAAVDASWARMEESLDISDEEEHD